MKKVIRFFLSLFNRSKKSKSEEVVPLSRIIENAPEVQEPVSPRGNILAAIQARRNCPPGQEFQFPYWGPDAGTEGYIEVAQELLVEGLISLGELLKLTLCMGYAEGQGYSTLGKFRQRSE
jgi:hypothetical protein